MSDPHPSNPKVQCPIVSVPSSPERPFRLDPHFYSTEQQRLLDRCRKELEKNPNPGGN